MLGGLLKNLLQNTPKWNGYWKPLKSQDVKILSKGTISLDTAQIYLTLDEHGLPDINLVSFPRYGSTSRPPLHCMWQIWKYVSYLLKVSGIPRALQFPLPVKLTTTIWP